jgi:hypothetical protein
VIDEPSIASLNTAVTCVLVATFMELIVGETLATVGAVVSRLGSDPVVNCQVWFDANAFPVISLTPVVIVIV